MGKIENIQEELKEILSEKRYMHSLGTMKMAQILSKKYDVDEEKAALVGLVHDIAKEFTKEKSLNYITKNKIQLDKIEEKNYSLWHAKIGAIFAKEKYQFTNDMQEAIRYHTTGHPNMDKLAKIIYVADKTEETRSYSEVEQVRKLALQNLDEAIIFILNYDIQRNIDKNRLIHPNSILIRNELMFKL